MPSLCYFLSFFMQVSRRLRERDDDLVAAEEDKRQLSQQGALIRRLQGDNDHLSKAEKLLSERLAATEAELDSALRELKRATTEVVRRVLTVQLARLVALVCTVRCAKTLRLRC
jgi:hypothetical protein